MALPWTMSQKVQVFAWCWHSCTIQSARELPAPPAVSHISWNKVKLILGDDGESKQYIQREASFKNCPQIHEHVFSITLRKVTLTVII